MAEPPRSQVVLTDKIRRWIRTVLTTENLPNDIRDELRKYSSTRRNAEDKKPRIIPFELVKTVHNYLQQQEDSIYLHELLEGSDVHLPENEEPTRSAELEERVQRLRAQQANKDYARMTRNVDLHQLKGETPISVGAEVKVMNNQLVAVLNFVITVVGAFVFAYKATEYTLDTPSVPLQICNGLVLGTIVFFADLYFMIKYTA